MGWTGTAAGSRVQRSLDAYFQAASLSLGGSSRRRCLWDLPSLAAGATALLDATITGARVGDLAQASLATISRFFELDATAWSNNTVRSLTRNVSNTTIDLARPPYRYRL